MKPYPKMRQITTEEFKTLFEEFVSRMREIGLGEKHKEYASEKDCLSNFRVYSWFGILCTVTQKLGRMINYSAKDVRVEEPVFMNDCLDTAFYMFLMFCCYRAEHVEKKNAAN